MNEEIKKPLTPEELRRRVLEAQKSGVCAEVPTKAEKAAASAKNAGEKASSRVKRAGEKVSSQARRAGKKASSEAKRAGEKISSEAKRARSFAKDKKTEAKKRFDKAKAQIESRRPVRSFVEDIKYDVDAIMERDPAARSRVEAVLLYSGIHALAAHRVAHALDRKGAHFTARAISQAARLLTGIEIHPGATIGRGLFIDHGSGVVIGETTIIGDDCTIYQGATLGGTGKETGKRHPTLGDRVMVGAGAKLLGNFKVGSGSKIAAGAVVLSDVPENSTAVGIPAKIVKKDGVRISDEVDLDQTHIPDPVAIRMDEMQRKIDELEQKIDPEKAPEKDDAGPADQSPDEN